MWSTSLLFYKYTHYCAAQRIWEMLEFMIIALIQLVSNCLLTGTCAISFFNITLIFSLIFIEWNFYNICAMLESEENEERRSGSTAHHKYHTFYIFSEIEDFRVMPQFPLSIFLTSLDFATHWNFFLQFCTKKCFERKKLY